MRKGPTPSHRSAVAKPHPATRAARRPSTEAPAVHPACRAHGHTLVSPLPQRLQAEMQNLKDQVQELHRDLTKHHSLIKAEIMGDILHKALQVDAQIASEYASVEGLRAVFQEVALPEAPPSPAAPPVSLLVGYPQIGSGRGPQPGAPGGLHRLWNLGLCCLEPRNFLGAHWNHGNCPGAPCGSEQLEDRNANNGTSNSAMCNIQLTFFFRFGRTPTSGWLTNRRYMKVPGSCC